MQANRLLCYLLGTGGVVSGNSGEELRSASVKTPLQTRRCCESVLMGDGLNSLPTYSPGVDCAAACPVS